MRTCGHSGSETIPTLLRPSLRSYRSQLPRNMPCCPKLTIPHPRHAQDPNNESREHSTPSPIHCVSNATSLWRGQYLCRIFVRPLKITNSADVSLPGAGPSREMPGGTDLGHRPTRLSGANSTAPTGFPKESCKDTPNLSLESHLAVLKGNFKQAPGMTSGQKNTLEETDNFT